MGLFSGISGDQDLEKIDQRIENVFTHIPSEEVNTSSTEDLTGSVFDSLLGDADIDEVTRLFDNVSIPYERIQRYGVYEELNRAVPIIKRIIRVYISNILQKNPVDGKCILLKPLRKFNNENDEDKLKIIKTKVEKVFKAFDLIRKLKTRILPEQLLYGDSFVEIVQVDKEAKKLKVSDVLALNESKELLREVTEIKENFNKNILEQRLDNIVKKLSKLLIVEDEDNVDKDATEFKLFNTLLRIHSPNTIIVLENDYGTTIGYLEIKRYTTDFASFTDISKVLSQTVGRVSSLSKYTTVDSNQLINKMIAYMLKNVLKKQGGDSFNSDKDIESVLKNLDEDAYNVIRRIIVEQGLNKKSNYQRIKVRFISPQNMFRFTIPSIDNHPYGESIVDPLVLPSKLYVLSQLSNIISKLSRAALIRTWTIDVGPTQMHSATIQKLKRELYNTRVTLEDLNSFKSIPKLLSDYKDLYLISKNGTKNLDVEIKSMGDASIKVADLEDARREIIALSGVPAPYLGYNDVVELREQLVHTNVAYATDIADLQEGISESLQKIVDRIFEINGEEVKPSEYIQISLIPPAVLILQLVEMTLSSVGNIGGVFQQMQIPFDPYQFLENYVPYIDWAQFREKAESYVGQIKAKNILGGDGAGEQGGF